MSGPRLLQSPPSESLMSSLELLYALGGECWGKG